MTVQGALFPTGPLSRRGDPDTSRIAAPSATALTELQQTVMALHRSHAGLTDDELVGLLPERTAGSVIKRRGECVRAGMLEDSGRRRPTRTGSSAIVWVVTR